VSKKLLRTINVSATRNGTAWKARRRMETRPAHGDELQVATQCNKQDAALSQGGMHDAAVLPYLMNDVV